MKTTKPHFTISLDKDPSYHVLRINLYVEDRCHSRSASLRFQSNAANPSDWYGSTLSIECDSMGDFETVTKMINRLFPKPDKFSYFHLNGQVAAVLTTLKAKAVESVYDNRLSQLVPIGEVLSPEFSAWRDDWKQYANSGDGCTVGCVARDEDEARQKLTVEFASLNYRKEKFEEWLKLGRPVKQLEKSHWGAPKVTTADSILKAIQDSQNAKQSVAA